MTTFPRLPIIPAVVHLSLRRELRPETTFAKTTDGWKIALHRYRPRGGVQAGQAPILLCHGLGANRYNLDAPGKLSLARHLCRHGFDCWVVELRGSGKSTRPHLFNRFKWDWNFDHYVKSDIPAALNAIGEATGEGRVHWVGHSMGGMVAYAYLMTFDPSRLRSVVAIASPSFAHVAHPIIDRAVRFRKLLRYVPTIPYSSASFLIAPLMPIFKPTVGRLFGNPENLDTRDLQKLVILVPQSLPTTLIAQFADWYALKGFMDGHQSTHYFRELHRIQSPTLIMAGSVDRLTPPKDLAHVFDSIGSKDKKLMVFGKESGCRHEYGHIDLVLGRHAPDEVFPHVQQWLEAH